VKSVGTPTKRKPELARSKRAASIQTGNASQRAVAMQVLKKLRLALRLAKSRSDNSQPRARATNAQIWVLREIGQQPGIRVTDLAFATALHQSTISNIIEKLRQRQLVRDKRDSIDARVAHLYLTAAGERAVASGPLAPQNDLLSTLEHLSAKTLNAIDRELTGLLGRTRGQV
jgi:DNA-binding MarR family transcriptional regulator